MFKETSAKFVAHKAILTNFVQSTTSWLSDMEHDLGKMDTDHTNLYYDYKDYCNQNEIKMKDLTV